MKKSKFYFEEEQKVDQWWMKLIIIVVLIVSLGPLCYGYYKQIFTGVPWGDKPMSDNGLLITIIITTLIMAAVVFLVFFSRLITKVKSDGIHIIFFPFFREKFIAREMIEKYEIRKYKPIIDYGGYGIRYSLIKGKAYNMSGNIGLQLYLKDNKKLLIGTKRSEAVKRAMDKFMS